MLGAMIFAGTDINFDPIGYAWQSVNSVLYVCGVMYQVMAPSSQRPAAPLPLPLPLPLPATASATRALHLSPSPFAFSRVDVWFPVTCPVYSLQSKYQKQLQSGNEQTAEGNALIEQSWTLCWAWAFANMGGELNPATRANIQQLPRAYVALLLLSGLGGFAISRSYAHLFAVSTSTSVTVAANVNRAIAVLVGALVFGTKLSYVQAFGLSLCFAR
jgi:hypothetical protein